MGKRRRAQKKVVKKVKPVVAKTFKCIFCNHEKSVQCSIDHKSMTGMLECGICGAKYQTHIHTLTEPIDIFTEWLDETAELQEKTAENIIRQNQERRAQRAAAAAEAAAFDEAPETAVGDGDGNEED
mmetsp:Transcript_22607/g.37736  ORF Transcript_22607/g.37736 Transcript_22607/m.37736 type:complete len:127 (+) Transcript_22607:54-434(+)